MVGWKSGSGKIIEESIDDKLVFRDLPCDTINARASSMYGACFRDFWNDYKECFPHYISTGSGCLIANETREQDKIDKPWCFAENCERLHSEDPVRYQLWP